MDTRTETEDGNKHHKGEIHTITPMIKKLGGTRTEMKGTILIRTGTTMLSIEANTQVCNEDMEKNT